MSAPVSFISPLLITSAMIASSTAVTHSTTEADWSSGTTYTKGTVVYRPTLGRRFENLIPGLNATPPEDDTDRWYDLGATDQMAMFDSETSTQSIADDTLTTVFQPGAFNSIFLAGLDGASLAITVKDTPGGSAVYSYSGSLEASAPDDYYEHFFDPFKPKTDFIAFGIAPYAACEVTITIDYPGRIARCGMASLGDLISLGGVALQGVTVEPKSYARITTDSRGKTSIKKGKAARDMSVSALVPLDDADGVVDALTNVLGVPCAWIGTDSTRLQAMRVFGLGNGKITYGGSQNAILNLTVQGMI